MISFLFLSRKNILLLLILCFFILPASADIPVITSITVDKLQVIGGGTVHFRINATSNVPLKGLNYCFVIDPSSCRYWGGGNIEEYSPNNWTTELSWEVSKYLPTGKYEFKAFRVVNEISTYSASWPSSIFINVSQFSIPIIPALLKPLVPRKI